MLVGHYFECDVSYGRKQITGTYTAGHIMIYPITIYLLLTHSLGCFVAGNTAAVITDQLLCVMVTK